MVDVRFQRVLPAQAPAPRRPEDMTGPVLAGPYVLHRIRYRPVTDAQGVAGGAPAPREDTITPNGWRRPPAVEGQSTMMVREYEPIPGDHQSLQAALAAAPPGRYFAVGRPGDDPAKLVAWFKCHDGTVYRGNIL